jgi:hypothetical protein
VWLFASLSIKALTELKRDEIVKEVLSKVLKKALEARF